MPASGESSGRTSWRGQILRKVEKDMGIKKLLLPEILKFGEKLFLVSPATLVSGQYKMVQDYEGESQKITDMSSASFLHCSFLYFCHFLKFQFLLQSKRNTGSAEKYIRISKREMFYHLSLTH